jgi:hypothetical protein
VHINHPLKCLRENVLSICADKKLELPENNPQNGSLSKRDLKLFYGKREKKLKCPVCRNKRSGLMTCSQSLGLWG